MGVLRCTGKNVGEKGNEDEEDHDGTKDRERDSASDTLRALGAGKPEAWGIPFTAYGTIW